ncbi:MAG: DUF2281 domain-containing protein [Hydrogenovibrio sp.]
MHELSLLEKINRLPRDKREEVIDFISFLESRYARSDAELKGVAPWTGESYLSMSLDQAMRGLEDEPEMYHDDDLKERWS